MGSKNQRLKKGQSTLEYVLVVSVIVAAIVAAAGLYLKPAANQTVSQAGSYLSGAANKLAVP